MKTYDPNIRWAEHTVELTYQLWDYKATATVSVNGNCRGFSVLHSAVSIHACELFDKEGECPTMILEMPDGAGGVDTLETNPDDDIDGWLESMCVGMRIVGHKEEEK